MTEQSSKNDKSNKGIRDWDQKKVVIRAVLNAFSISDIFDKIYPDDPDMAEKTHSKFRTWHNSTPTSKESREFFDKLAEKMRCRPGTTGIKLVISGIDEFISLLGSEDDIDIACKELDRAGYSDDRNEPSAIISPEFLGGIYPMLPDNSSENFRNILVSRSGKIEDIYSNIRKGRINEKHYFLTPDAALIWIELINSDSYPTYDQCKSSLKSLVSSEDWKKIIHEKPITSAVMLCGGGSPTKDMVIINSIIDQPSSNNNAIDYLIVDISPYMLFYSVWWLEEKVSKIAGGNKINLIGLCEDVFAKLHKSTFSRGDGRTLFAITGGTIGNLREDKFFRHVPAVAGDLLIISADSLPENDPKNVQSLIEKYNHREMHRFIRPAINALICEFDLQESFAKTYERVKVNILDGDRANSDIPKSASVTLTANINERKLVLLSSTRYVHDELVNFANSRGWKFKCSFASPYNPNFMQFLFEKIAQ